MKPARWAAACVFAVLWAGGIGAQFRSGPRPPMWIAPLFLTLAAALAMERDAARLALAGGAALAVEAAGVRWGIPFGTYRYTHALGPQAAGVPVAIGCAWVVLLAYTRSIGTRLPLGRAAMVVAGALWMASLDLAVDPVAVNVFGYWQWPGGGPYFGIPLSNTLGWFCASAALLAAAGRPCERSRWAEFAGAAVMAFFGVAALAGRLWIPAAVAAAVLLIHATLPHLARNR